MTPHARAFFLEEEKQNQKLIAYAKIAIISIISLFDYLGHLGGEQWSDFIASFIENLLFLPIAFLQIWLARQRFYWPILKYVFLTIDVLMIAILISIVNPYNSIAGTELENVYLLSFFRDQDMILLYVLYSWVLLNYSIRFLIWFGFCIVIAWIAQFIYVSQIPGVFTAGSIPEPLKSLKNMRSKPGWLMS